MEIQPFPAVVVVSAAVAAAVTDIWKFRVYNLLTVPLLVAGILYHSAFGGWDGLKESVCGMLCGFGVLTMFCLLGGMGWGDAKLLAALGAWMGPEGVFYIFVASSIAGGVFAVYLVVRHGQLSETWLRLKIVCYRLAAVGRYLGADDGVVMEAGGRVDRRRVIPFAAMMCIGVIATLLWLWWNTARS